MLKANGHKEAEQVRNAKKSSCYQKGYTGDKYCEDVMKLCRKERQFLSLSMNTKMMYVKTAEE